MAAPAYKNFTQAALSDTGTATSPSDTAIGDLVVCIVWSQGTNAATLTHTVQSTFTTVRSHSHDDGTTDGRLSVAVKVATVAGAQSYVPYTIANATAGQTCAAIITVTGADTTSPGSWVQNSITDTGNTAPNPPSLTGLNGDALVLAIAAWHVTTAGTTSATVMANYTLRVNGPAGSHVTHLAVATRALTWLTSGTEDPATYTDNVTPNGTVAMTISIPYVAATGLLASLAGYWTMDESSGNRADSSGYGSTEVEANGVLSSTTGKVSNAGSFVKASNKWLRCPSNSSVSMGNFDFSLSCWVKLTTKAADVVIVGKSGATNGTWQITYKVAPDRFVWQTFGLAAYGGYAEAVANTLGSPSTGTWYFVICDHNATADTISIQVNNGTIDSAAQTNGTFVESTNDLVFSTGDPAQQLDGVLDEVGIWRRTLTTTERSDLYNGGNGLTYPFTPTGLSVSLTEALTLGEVRSGAAGFARSQADAMTLAEVLAKIATYLRSYADALTLGESVAKQLQIQRALTDALSLAESVTRALVLTRSLGEPLTLGEALARSAAFARVQTEALSLGENLAKLMAFSRGHIEPISLGDALAKSINFSRSLTEPISLGEALLRFITLVRSLADAIGMADAVALILTAMARALQDALNLVDAVAVSLVTVISRALADVLALSEAIELLLIVSPITPGGGGWGRVSLPRVEIQLREISELFGDQYSEEEQAAILAAIMWTLK